MGHNELLPAEALAGVPRERIELAVPAAAAAGERYPGMLMKHFDSER